MGRITRWNGDDKPHRAMNQGQRHQKVERLALRAVAPRRAARGWPLCWGPPAERGRVGSQRDPTHHSDSIGASHF
jgi:hypothetical protein